MIRRVFNSNFTIFIALCSAAIMMVSCNNGDSAPATKNRSSDESEPYKICTIEPSENPNQSSGPPGLPYIFKGKYYVNGELGPPNQRIYVKLVTSRSQITRTLDEGVYIGLIHGPVSEKDWDVPFVFCLGDPEGDAVVAEESYEYKNLGHPQDVELDLHFPRLPKE